MTKKRSIFGFMFHMTSLWQVNGIGNLSRSGVTAMVKSTGHIIVTSITVEMNLHNLDQSSYVSSFTSDMIFVTSITSSACVKSSAFG